MLGVENRSESLKKKNLKKQQHNRNLKMNTVYRKIVHTYGLCSNKLFKSRSSSRSKVNKDDKINESDAGLVKLSFQRI